MAIKPVQLVTASEETYEDYPEPKYSSFPAYMKKDLKQTWEAWHKMSQSERKNYMQEMPKIYGKGKSSDAAVDKLNDKYGLPRSTYHEHFR